MYEPAFQIDRKVYPYLIRFCLSMGYEVKTNDTHTLLYDIRCVDPIRVRELAKNEAAASLNRVEAADLVGALDAIRGCKGKEPYDPPYHPMIRLDEDMYQRHFLPDMEEGGYEVVAVNGGMVWHVMRVALSGYNAQNWDTDCSVLCRSEVTGMVRDLEYERRMSPFLVTSNLNRNGCHAQRKWQNGLDTVEKAVDVLERQEPQNFPETDWRIYMDITAIARQLKEPVMFRDLPDDVLVPEGWLWLRIWHPGEDGADYWYEETFDELSRLHVAIVDAEALDMYSVTAVYACVRHEAPAEEEAAAEEEAEPPLYKLLYWSTRKKQDIAEPYGEAVVQDVAVLKKAALTIMRNRDIYKFETWKRLACVEGKIVVEEYHGNEAHLSLKNAKMESEE